MEFYYSKIKEFMVKQQVPKLLIISRGVWDDTMGTSSTLTNLFEDYEPDRLAHLYIETIAPNTKCCHCFFQISEISLVRKLYNWRTQTGHCFDTRKQELAVTDNKIAEKEASTMQYVRGHRSIWMSFAREILWAFNGWKSNELKRFIMEFSPDVVWLDGSPLPLMNRRFDYVLNIAKKPAVIFMQDDVYTYESCGSRWSDKLYKWMLRKKVRKVVQQCADMFVISPKMKKEYDDIFKLNSTLITKGIDIDRISPASHEIHNPLRLVYLGQVIYGRIYSLISIAEALENINADGVKMQLFVYTNNQIDEEDKKKLLVKNNVFLMPPVPYYDVPRVMNENDVVVFVESFEPQFCNVARLSFSTKICDYLASGKCILAIGPRNIAPIEYLKEEDAAVVATSKDEIVDAIQRLSDKNVVEKYVNQARECALRNHDRKRMNEVVYGKINALVNNKNIYHEQIR